MRLRRQRTSPVTPRSSSSRTATRRSSCMRPQPWRPSTASSWLSRRWKRFLSRPWEARIMRNIFLIARREYLEQIRGRAFKISTVALPLLLAAMLAFSYYMEHKAGKGKHIVIVADDATLANEVRRQMLDDKDARYTVDVTAPASAEARKEWKRQVSAKTIDGVLAIDSSNPLKITATFTSLSAAEVSAYSGLPSALNRGVINERMIGKGMN